MPCHWTIIKRIRIKINKKDSLQTVTNSNKNTFPPTDVELKDFGRVSPYSSPNKTLPPKGALTVEAALLLPLFFMGMVALFSLMDIYRIQAQVTVSLNESAKELGMYAYAARNNPTQSPLGIINDAVCIAYAGHKLKRENGVVIELRRSRYQNQQVELVADISYRLMAAPFPLPNIRFQSRVKVHDWTGYSGADRDSANAAAMVYITDRETVYHTRFDCSHLDLTIIATTKKRAEKQRNVSGAKYYACPNCTKDGDAAGQCYITKSGDRYHISRSCSSLTRNIRLIPKATAGAKNECRRCIAKGAE